MKNFMYSKSPAEDIAQHLKSNFSLENHGLKHLRQVYWNLPTEALYEEAIYRGEGRVTDMGALLVHSGEHTARAAKDKYVVKEPSTEDEIWWGEHNIPIDEEKFDELLCRIQGYLQGRDVFVQDCLVGSDKKYEMPIRIITEHAWQSHFARNMFIQHPEVEDYKNHIPDFTLIAVPSFKAKGEEDGLRSEAFIILNIAKKMVIIGNTGYGGEIKKSIFTVMNYLLPKLGIMTMHCSANQGESDDVALFFGLSGTGKTSLSADPNRGLIGDDEHGWSDDGIFNFEDGCYAKVIRLSPTAEPQIYQTTRTFGTILENVIFDPQTRKIDLDDDEITENTRASYPLRYISNAIPEKKGGHPKNIILLTCDAQGVLPPIAKLSSDQAMYHFISGYTSKIGGTEIGIGKAPALTFSACFGAPFMVHHPIFYANLLSKRMEKHNSSCWLLNTGWVGGPFGIGKRISIKHTRAILTATLNGDLLDVEYYHDPIFGFMVPKTCPGVPDSVLFPADSWPNREEYDKIYKQLAGRFIENFKNFELECPENVRNSGPKI